MRYTSEEVLMNKIHVPEYWDVAKYYDLISSKFVNYDKQVLFLTQIFNKYKIPGKRILDIACGTGTHSLKLSKKGYEVIGLDASEKMLEVARKKAVSNANVQFICKDMQKLDFKEEFDAVICMSSISFLLTLTDIKKTILGVNRSLCSEGVFIFNFLPIFDTTEKNEIEHVKEGNIEIWIMHHGSINRMEQTFDEKLTYILREDDKISIHQGFDRARLYFPIDFVRYLEIEGDFKIIGYYECWDLGKTLEGNHLAIIIRKNKT